MNILLNNFNNYIVKFNLFRQELVWGIMRYLDSILFLIVIIKINLDLVNFCHSVVDHMSVFNYCTGDHLLQMSSNNSGTGSGLPGNS